jgi:hypothetical protein
MRRGGFAVFVCASVLQFGMSAPANAQARSTYYIRLYSYFSSLATPAFPITTPQNEQPGDVYSRPGVLYARKADCFKDEKIDSSPTYFPDEIVLDSSNVAAEVAIEQRAIAEAVVAAGGELSKRVGISYGENGKGKWNQIAEKDLISILTNPNSNACREKILETLRSATRIPWIIQSVFYATVNLSYQTTSLLDASAKAAIEKRLPAKVGGAITTEQKSDTLLIANTGNTAFPIAWRPAFISSDHYNYVNQLMEQSWLRYLLSRVWLDKSDQEILEILQNDFKLDLNKLPRPKDIAEGISSGKPIEFEPTNENHLQYVRAVNVLSGVSQAIDRDSRPK